MKEGKRGERRNKYEERGEEGGRRGWGIADVELELLAVLFDVLRFLKEDKKRKR